MDQLQAGAGEMLYELLKYKERLSAALRSAGICVFEVDLVRQLYTYFENSEAIFGVPGRQILQEVQPFSKLPAKEYQGAVSRYFSHVDDAAVISEAFERINRGEQAAYQARMRAGKSQYTWCKVDVTPIMEDGRPVRMIGVISDISEMKAKADRLEEAARLDSFTGLYAKTHCERLIREALADQPEQRHALVLFDLDDFKMINDTYGHPAGDAVLQSVAEGLKNSFGGSDISGRFGGDEFIILLREVQGHTDLCRKLDLLAESRDNALQATKSIGAAVYPEDGKTFETLLERADLALYCAKRKKDSYVLFSDLKRGFMPYAAD